MYVKAIRWASDRIIKNGEGIVAFVTNNSFIDQIAFDGMRKHLAQDFDEIYVLDLGGNVRKNPKLSGTTHNVFGIQVGVSINFFVRKKASSRHRRQNLLRRRPRRLVQGAEIRFFGGTGRLPHYPLAGNRPGPELYLADRGIGKGLRDFFSVGGKEAKAGRGQAIFKNYGNGVQTKRDAWAYNYSLMRLSENIQRLIENYNDQVGKWQA